MAGSLLIAACGPAERPSTGGPAVKTFRYSMDQAPTTLDPVQGSNIYANFVIVNAYDTLYSYKSRRSMKGWFIPIRSFPAVCAAVKSFPST